MTDSTFDLQVIIISGLSGAGKSTALNVFEDLGFFCVDGLPVHLLPSVTSLFSSKGNLKYKGLALGLDFREDGFLDDWEQAKQKLVEGGVSWQILFLEASPEILNRRYATTRRPHPLEVLGNSLESAIHQEKQILEPIKQEAELVIDTSHYSVHDLRRSLQDKWFFLKEGQCGMRVHLVSFGFKYGVPSEADLMFDLRFLPNPYFDEKLRPLSGKEQIIADYVLAEDPGKSFLSRLTDFLGYIVPLYAQEGRYRLTIAIGCTGGRHRSVATAEAVYKYFKDNGYAVSLEHRHLELG